MKLILNKNRINEVEKIPKDIEQNSVKFEGYDLEGESIELYDMEAGKIAPYVKYLMENDEGGRRGIFLYIILGIVALFFIILAIVFFPGGDKKEQVKTQPLTVTPVVKNEDTQTTERIKKEAANEIDMYKDIVQDAELESLRAKYDLERKNFESMKKDDKINDLEKENLELKNLLEKQQNQLNIIERMPPDDFIYHLGYNVYQKCENTTDEKIMQNCKDLYYNFLKNENR